MPLNPLVQFVCDACGEIIERIEDGWIEWLHDDEHRNHGFRIVHHAATAREMGRRCYAYDRHPDRADMHLHDFVGNVGLVRALSLLHPGDLHSSEPNQCYIRNANEYAVLLRRLTLPYYEEGRLYFDEAEADGFIGDANEVLVYTEDFLQGLVERYSRY